MKKQEIARLLITIIGPYTNFQDLTFQNDQDDVGE